MNTQPPQNVAIRLQTTISPQTALLPIKYPCSPSIYCSDSYDICSVRVAHQWLSSTAGSANTLKTLLALI
jgi:hypothetical protein